MKKLIMIGFVFLAVLVAIMLIFLPKKTEATANDGELNDIIIDETKGSKTFSEDYLPMIIDFAVVAGGVASILMPAMSKINKAKAGFESAKDSLNKANEDRFRELKRCRSKELELQAREARIVSIEDKLETVLKMLEIGFTNDPHLVSNGHARRIAKLVEGEDNCDEIENQAKD